MSTFNKRRDTFRRFGSQPKLRWRIYVACAIVFALLAVLPRQYVARGKIVPDSTNGNSLAGVVGALGGRLQNFASLFGDRGTIEVALSISRSQSIANAVIRREKLVESGRYASFRAAQLGLAKSVDIYSLTGGMLEVQTRSGDPEWALRMTRAYLTTISERLAAFGAEQIERKRRIVDGRIKDASARLSRAENDLNVFKRRNRLPDPQQQLGSQLALRTGLEAQLQARLVELQSTRQTAGAENTSLRVIENQVATIRRQLADSVQRERAVSGLSSSGISDLSFQYANLYRRYLFAQQLYEVYTRSAEEVAVQQIVYQDAGEAAVVDPPHVDAERYFNNWALALLGLLGLAVFVYEFYGPATGLWQVKDGRAEI